MTHSRTLVWFTLVLGCLGACAGAAGEGQSGDGGVTGSAGRTVVSATGGAGVVAGSGGAAVVSETGGSPGATGSGGAPAAGGGASATGGSATTGGSTGSGGRGGDTRTGGASGPGGAIGTGGGGFDAGVDAQRPTDASLGASDANQGALPNVTLHLAGDSTVMTYAAPTATADEGWGQELGQYLINKVSINNQALGGASVEMFHSGRWTNIMNAIKPGDYVMAAFGANDSGTVEGRHVEVPAFQAFYIQMADEVKAKQGIFIPVTPSAMREFTGTKEGNTRLGPYAAAIVAAGATKNLPVVDLNARSVELLNMIGPTGAMSLYKAADKAHFTKAGATQMAQFVATELRRVGSPFAAYLK